MPEISFIAFDWCGSLQQYGRFTSCIVGEESKTLLQKACYGQAEWDRVQRDWFKNFPHETPVHDCPGTYTTIGTRVMGTVGEIIKRLEDRLISWGDMKEEDRTLTPQQKRLARKVAERIIEKPEIIEKLIVAFQEEPEEWGSEP